MGRAAFELSVVECRVVSSYLYLLHSRLYSDHVTQARLGPFLPFTRIDPVAVQRELVVEARAS